MASRGPFGKDKIPKGVTIHREGCVYPEGGPHAGKVEAGFTKCGEQLIGKRDADPKKGIEAVEIATWVTDDDTEVNCKACLAMK